jgi:hypothetical protein
MMTNVHHIVRTNFCAKLPVTRTAVKMILMGHAMESNILIKAYLARIYQTVVVYPYLMVRENK